MIPQRNLSLLSNRLARSGDRRIPETVLERLKGAVEEKLGFRGKKLDDVRSEFSAKEARLKKLWDTRLSAQMASLPQFDGVYRSVRRAFRQAGLS